MYAELKPGFQDPVTDAQLVFRKTLRALSEPGVVETFANEKLALPGLYASTVALLLTLLDKDTTLWLSKPLRTEVIQSNLTFHCTCPINENQTKAQFAVYDLDEFLQDGNRNFSQGSERYPDQSATIILQLPENANLAQSIWQGPGILGSKTCQLPLLADFWQQRQTMIAFPLGIDFLLTSPNSLIGLPRSTQVLFKEDVICM